MIGQVLGPYKIVSKLGEGGMGVVYRATDERLGRDVAIKVLPETFARDRERMARFEREARTLASLNHPNIAQLYGVEQGALVMELAEGEQLRCPVPVETAISMYQFRAEDVVANIAPRPLLLFHTANDVITPTEQSVRLYEKAGQPAELMIVNGTSHFPLSEKDAPRTRVLVRSWLDQFFPTPVRGR